MVGYFDIERSKVLHITKKDKDNEVKNFGLSAPTWSRREIQA
jgi:hypothetical protein